MEELRKSPITWILIAWNALIFLAVELTGGSNDISNMVRWGASFAPMIQEQGQYYRLFTCMFLHFGLEHLGYNMLILYFVGGHLERAVGKIRFLLIYLIGGIGASYCSYYVDILRQDAVVSAGASGAIFAALGGLLWILILNRGRLEEISLKKLLLMALLCLYYGFASTGVDNIAHIGGFVLGFVLAVLLCHRPQHRKNQSVVNGSEI